MHVRQHRLWVEPVQLEELGRVLLLPVLLRGWLDFGGMDEGDGNR